MRSYISILLFCLGLSVSAQNISVSDFHQDEMDLTANQQGTIVLDQNGEKCALIKVLTTQTGLTFDVGSLGVQKTVQKPGEIWVYVPAGVRKMSISHPTLGQLRDYQIPMAITKARTYVMQLTRANVRTIVEEQVTMQYLIINVTPKRATVLIDGKPVLNENGTVMEFLPFGKHTYQVTQLGYFAEEGIVDLTESSGKIIKDITLRPDKATVKIVCQDKNAEIWINNRQYGTGSWEGTLAGGTYSIEARIAGFHSRTLMQTISSYSENKTINIPALVPATGRLNINVRPVGAHIFVDGKEQGTTPNIITIDKGEHNVTIKKEGYDDYVKELTIEEGKIQALTASMTKTVIVEKTAGPENKMQPDKKKNVESATLKALEGISSSMSLEVKTLYVKAVAGDVNAQNDIAKRYRRGDGVEKDYKKSFEWSMKAALQGNATAQREIGERYKKGQGVEKDANKAFEWFIKSAQQGNMYAQGRIGECYENGEGVKINYDKAYEWYKKSADGGNSGGIKDVGRCYEFGWGVELDYKKAFEWYKKSAGKDDSSGMYHVGVCYEKGLGVEKNMDKAIEWYKKAASRKNKDAKKNLRRLGVEGY